jgi:hypothetical protein
VNRAQRRSQAVKLRRMLKTNPYWMDHLRQFPQVSIDAPVHGCASHCGGGEIDGAACDCGAVVTKHIEPLGS